MNEGTVIIDGLGRGGGKKIRGFLGDHMVFRGNRGGVSRTKQGARIKNWLLINCNEVVVVVDVVVVVVVVVGRGGRGILENIIEPYG